METTSRLKKNNTPLVRDKLISKFSNEIHLPIKNCPKNKLEGKMLISHGRITCALEDLALFT